MIYRLPEASFELCAEHIDQSVTVLNVSTNDGASLRIVATRARVAVGTSAANQADADIVQRQRMQERFELLWRRDHQLDGRAAVIVASRAEEQSDPLAQRHLYVVDGSMALVLTFSTAGDFNPAQMEVLRRIDQSFRFWDKL